MWPGAHPPKKRGKCRSSTVDTGLWWAGGSASESAQASRMARLAPPHKNRAELDGHIPEMWHQPAGHQHDPSATGPLRSFLAPTGAGDFEGKTCASGLECVAYGGLGDDRSW